MTDKDKDSWQTVDSADMIALLRRQIGELEYQLQIKELQIRNLLKQPSE